MPRRTDVHTDELPAGITPEEVLWYSVRRREDIRIALRQFSKRATAGFLILLVGLIVQNRVSQHDTEKTATQLAVATKQTAAIARRADALAQLIQEQRVASVRMNCEDTNDRHKRAIKSLTALIPASRPPAERARSEIVVAALAEAVAPLRNCTAVVAAATRPPDTFDPKTHG
jgi:hypothetical protein